MTKNEVDRVIELLERTAEKAYYQGRLDELNNTESPPTDHFRVSAGVRLLVMRELNRR